MKHPLPESPFPPASFSQEDCLEFRRLALALVDECLDEYDEHVGTNDRTVNKRKWKELKAIENVAVYKRMTREEAKLARTPLPSTASSMARESSSSSSSSSGKSFVSNHEFQTPRIIAVGKVVGTLEDVMYGIVAPDKEAMRVNTTYLDDELIDSRVLCSMQCPTETKPFQFLGLKWVVRAPGSIVKPRDLVFIECTGIKTRANGERVGYCVQHSVDVPQFDELKMLGIVRSRQSCTSVFRETSNGAVELYTRLYTDAGGNVSERLALQAAANSLLTVWKVPSCAHNKKLAWLMRDSSAKRNPQVVAKAKSERVKHCKLCAKSVSAFGTLTTCELCLHKICSRCLTMRKLSYMRATGQVFTVPTSFCKNCIARGARSSASDISIMEYVPDAEPREPEIIELSEVFHTNTSTSSVRRGGVRDSTRSAPPGPTSFTSTTPLAASTPIAHASSLPTGHVSDSLYDSGRGGTPIYLHEPPIRGSSRQGAMPPTHNHHGGVATAYAVPVQPRGLPRGNPYLQPQPHQQPLPPYQSPQHQSRMAPPHVVPYATSEPLHPDEHRRVLWEQMTQLRIQAEEAYWQTKRNGYVMHEDDH